MNWGNRDQEWEQEQNKTYYGKQTPSTFEVDVFVIERCKDCQKHQAYTRHDEAKYQQFYQLLAEQIKLFCQSNDVQVLENQIPQKWFEFPLYEGKVDPYDQQTLYPIIGAFEVSYNGVLLFSKFESGLWPRLSLVAKKCAKARQSLIDNKDLDFVKANLQFHKRVQSNSSEKFGSSYGQNNSQYVQRQSRQTTAQHNRNRTSQIRSAAGASRDKVQSPTNNKSLNAQSQIIQNNNNQITEQPQQQIQPQSQKVIQQEQQQKQQVVSLNQEVLHESDDGGLEEDEDLTKELEQKNKNKPAQPPYVLTEKEQQENAETIEEQWDLYSECNGYVLYQESCSLLVEELTRRELETDLNQLKAHIEWFECDTNKKLLPSEWKKIFAAPIVRMNQLAEQWKLKYSFKAQLQNYNHLQQNQEEFHSFFHELFDDLSEGYGFVSFKDLKDTVHQWVRLTSTVEHKDNFMKYLKNLYLNDSKKLIQSEFQEICYVIFLILFNNYKTQLNYFKFQENESKESLQAQNESAYNKAILDSEQIFDELSKGVGYVQTKDVCSHLLQKYSSQGGSKQYIDQLRLYTTVLPRENGGKHVKSSYEQLFLKAIFSFHNSQK